MILFFVVKKLPVFKGMIQKKQKIGILCQSLKR